MGKAQVKMFESISVLIVFFVLLAFGIIIYAYFQKDASKVKFEEQQQVRAMRVARIAISLPELQCSKREPSEHCLDTERIAAFRSYYSTSDAVKNRYYDLLGDSRVYVVEVYPTPACTADTQCNQGPPLPNPERKCIKGACTVEVYNRLDSKKSIIHTWSPVAVFNPKTDSSNYGMLVVDVNE
ncbi:MAG: hypothetical protein HY544_05470 [Candidatus Diapherotrites archaeon]|uniref:Uncharacterized protein n=1 Tax=Candidatus Iainarchaeum sp. TaxID=3101447 RepID=A0A8T3YMH3_9ARCH|nr:hypothetical protein [Candidatus Diapherotrites archaeon]